jgi:nucleotide-binding universal stress UspA family protein/Zn-finger nucleic acid-binding protein
MPEKDRFGDKLREKERGEEAQYFAKRDRELVEKKHIPAERRGEVSIREAALRRCPECAKRLANHSFDAIAVAECPYCRGIWISRDGIESVARRESESFLGRFFSMTEQAMNGRTTLRTIVAATDFSENAEIALAWAEQLAGQHRATLILVHASGFEPVAAPDYVPLPEECYDQVRTSAKAQLEREAEKARRGGVTVECELGFGLASEIVIAAAQRYDADVIVAGTRGHTGWKRLFLGSTAARLVRQAQCPVLTVQHSDAGPPRPIRTVLVATDFSEDAGLATEAATRILGTTGPDRRIVLLHAYRVPFEASYLPGPILADAISAADVEVKQTIERLAAKLRDTGLNVDTVICEGYPPDKIVEQARSIRADLISIGTHGRSGVNRLFLGSTAERVLGSAPCPVLTVRRESST